MVDWLRPLWLMFYSPMRGMAEARDRAPVVAALVLAFLAQLGYVCFTEWLYWRNLLGARSVALLYGLSFQVFGTILFVAIIFVPIIVLVANLLDRRGSFSLVLQQEYASLASTLCYGWAAAHLLAIPFAYFAASGGTLERVVANSVETARNFYQWTPQQWAIIGDPHKYAQYFFWSVMLPIFLLFALAAVRTVFRLSALRTIAVVFIGSFVTYLAASFLAPLFGWVFASPFLLLVLFLFLRGYLGEMTRGHRARASFKQNLEAATLNPADASAHYNLGLIHQQRNEFDEARQRFERAVEIDGDETDAHFQLGRIARQQGRLSEAIEHFGPVVESNPAHAQYEIWREIGATYLEAGQFEDARTALEQFLEHRTSDPEGLYLMGRAHAGLGHKSEAAAAMQACIEAVKTAPAYKYRTEKRWLNQAQEFLRQG